MHVNPECIVSYSEVCLSAGLENIFVQKVNALKVQLHVPQDFLLQNLQQDVTKE